MGQMYKKILVPLDGSDIAECALEHVKAIALGCNVPEVILFRVVEPLYTGADAMSYGAVMYADLINQVEKEAQEYSTEVTEKFKKNTGINAQSVLAHGNAADEILEYSKKNKVDLIIMTTHGRSGISRWLFGNVADKVSHHSTAPVLIIAPSGCRIDQIDRNKKVKAKIK
jgi:nucleotide-binding universal stress UspA family protein